jgi:hypothetical protein
VGDRPGFWSALTHHAVLLLPALPSLCGPERLSGNARK